jgi:FAD/FMN-containing dehydrogenase
MYSKNFLRTLQKELPDCIRFAIADELEPYSHDRTLKQNFAPACVLFPETTEEVAAIVRLAFEYRQPLAISGGRTGYAGGAVAAEDEVILSLEKMNRLLGFDPYLPALHVQAGMTTRAVQQEAASRGYFFPVDFASASTSHIGGNLATHAGGIRVLKYGTIRRYTIGLTAVDGCGEILRFPDLIKNNTGYDLKELLLGSEGTLAVITEATLKLVSPPPATDLALLAFPEFSSLLAALALLNPLSLYAFEVFDDACLRLICEHRSLPEPFDEIPAFTALVEYEPGKAETVLMSVPASDIRLAADEAQRRRFWIYREGISEALSLAGRVHKNDISVPVARAEQTIDALRKIQEETLTGSLFIFGHLADGNLHINVVAPADADEAVFRAKAAEFDRRSYAYLSSVGGSISAEHGIGRLKKDYLHFGRSKREIDLMRSIKMAFDPQNILNRGRIF